VIRATAIERIRKVLNPNRRYNNMTPDILRVLGDTLTGIIDGTIPLKGKGGRPKAEKPADEKPDEKPTDEKPAK
jgi:hypothetical protein